MNETRPTCAGCQYWSELVARCYGQKVEALCLHPDKHPAYVHEGCEDRAEGPPVDLPRPEAR